MILISFKIVVIFKTTSADIKSVVIFNTNSADIKTTKSADVILKMTIILKEMRISQLCSKSERTLVADSFHRAVTNKNSQKFA